MTVGVAAFGENGMIAMAADRMVTRGATQTEPSWQKIYNVPFGVGVTVMWAGSAANFGEAFQMYLATVRTHPDRFKIVSDHVDQYVASFAAMLGKRAERQSLAPLGLTRLDLVSSRLTSERAGDLMERIFSFGLSPEDSVEVIIAGHDEGGAHIWRVYNADPSCHDMEAFAAIGIGAEHADAQLRLIGHTPGSKAHETFIATYFAKRRAELAPMVGATTDMVVRSHNQEPIHIDERIQTVLGSAFDEYATAQRDSLARATAIASSALNTLAMAPPPPDVMPPLQGNSEQAPAHPPATTPDSSPLRTSQG